MISEKNKGKLLPVVQKAPMFILFVWNGNIFFKCLFNDVKFCKEKFGGTKSNFRKIFEIFSVVNI